MSNNDEQPPTPIAPLEGAKTKDGSDAMEYYAYNAADRLEYVKEQIEEREKAYFNLTLIHMSLDGNPESGEHIKRVEPKEGMPQQAPCVCRDCELPRVTSLLVSMKYAVNKLKAVHSSLT